MESARSSRRSIKLQNAGLFIAMLLNAAKRDSTKRSPPHLRNSFRVDFSTRGAVHQSPRSKSPLRVSPDAHILTNDSVSFSSLFGGRLSRDVRPFDSFRCKLAFQFCAARGYRSLQRSVLSKKIQIRGAACYPFYFQRGA